MDNAGGRGRRFRRRHVASMLAQHAVAGIVPGDHVCASFGSDEEHRAIVGRFARQALRRGERFLYLAHASDQRTICDHLEAEGIDAAAGIALGQIEIRPFAVDRGPLDPEALVAALQTHRRAALGDGYRALCVESEMTWALARVAEIDAIARYERQLDRVFASGEVAGICQYDRRRFEPDVLEQLVARHAFQVCTDRHLTTTARRRLTISEHEDGLIALSGALDIDSSAYLAARFAEISHTGDLVVMTSGLGFADVSGCRALVHAAERLEGGRHMVLPDAAEPLVRVLKLCGWSPSGHLVLR